MNKSTQRIVGSTIMIFFACTTLMFDGVSIYISTFIAFVLMFFGMWFEQIVEAIEANK
jgi:hypothetical protein